MSESESTEIVALDEGSVFPDVEPADAGLKLRERESYRSKHHMTADGRHRSKAAGGDTVAESMYQLVASVVAPQSVSRAEKMLEALSDEQMANIWSKAEKRTKVVMAALAPVAFRTMRRLMVNYMKTGDDGKTAGVAAARILDFLKTTQPMVVVNNNVGMAVTSHLNLPKQEARQEPAPIETKARVRVEVLPEATPMRFGAARSQGELLRMPEPEHLPLPEPPAPLRSQERTEVVVSPATRYRDDE